MEKGSPKKILVVSIEAATVPLAPGAEVKVPEIEWVYIHSDSDLQKFYQERLSQLSSDREVSLFEPAEAKTDILALEGVQLDRIKRIFYRGEKTVTLLHNEFLLLELLMKNPGTTFSKEQILEKVWGYKYDPHTNVVDVLVYRLRTKIDRGFSRPLLQTVRGQGIRLLTSDKTQSDA